LLARPKSIQALGRTELDNGEKQERGA